MKTLTICPSCSKLNRVDVDGAKASQSTCGHCKKDLPIHGAYSELSEIELKNLIAKSSKPVVVDFWAPWCGPCKMFAPHFQQVAEQDAEEYVFVKVNTQAHPTAGAQYGVRGIPTLAVFNRGNEVKRVSGAMQASQFKQWLKDVR